MKKIILVTSLFFSFLGFSQNGKAILKWNDDFKNKVNSYNSQPKFQNENYYFNSSINQFFYFDRINVQKSINEKSFKLNNIVYEVVDINRLQGIDLNLVPKTIEYKVQNFYADGKNSVLLELNPIVNHHGIYKRVVSFEYSFELAKEYQNHQNLNAITKGNSVLATGEWFKIEINQSGVYKLDKNFLSRIGIPNNVDPRTIKIYGNGGKPLPLKNAENLYFDLPEIAIKIEGESDGVFNDEDYVLFYGKSVYGWDAENLSHLNVYSDKAYYFITYGDTRGKRISEVSQPSVNATHQFTFFDEHLFHEKNLVNIGYLSRKWFGENFNVVNTQSFNFDLINLVSSEPVFLNSVVAARSPNTSFFNFSQNNQSFGGVTIFGNSSDFYARESYFETSFNTSVPNVTIQLSFNNNGVPSANGYLDFIALDYKKYLKGYNKQFGFRINEVSNLIGVGAYQFTEASSIQMIWDITDVYNVKHIFTNSSANFSFKAFLGDFREYQAVSSLDYYVPKIPTDFRVKNQNLKGEIFADGDVDYLIITSPDLQSAAERLAQFHKQNSKLNTKVVLINTIYNEFSSGQQDISAIRNFVRYVYENASDSSKRVKFLNMFGDTNPDYLNEFSKDNKVPSFYSLNYNPIYNNWNFHTKESFVTDDFFVLMDLEEGFIVGQNYSGLDIAVGRMPFTTLEQANVVVDKIVNYNSVNNSGRWKNNIIALADDVDDFGDETLQGSLNQMVDELGEYRPFFNATKIYTDAYVQEVTSGGPRYPKAKAEFLQAVDNGALMVNYLGHGGEYGLAQERLLETYDIDKLNNGAKLPLFSIVTCEYTRFDNPTDLSGGERLFLKNNGGAIGLIATTRKILISNANDFTKDFSKVLFDYDSDGVKYPSVAEALRITKNKFNSPEKAVIFCIGDPALHLSVGKPKVQLTAINGIVVSESTPPLKALDLVKLEGQVTDVNGNLLSSFDGDLSIQIFDKDIARKTLANDGFPQYIMEFNTLGETIFRGNATVVNGKFEFEFVVPKDIRIPVGNGKVSFYAKKNGNILEDYTGENKSVRIGGVNENAPEDNTPPNIQLYMNDKSFISGGITNASPLLLIDFQDENGINTASGIGHDIVAILDENENNQIVLNDYYETESNNFRKGVIKYPLNELEKGRHTLKVKAWDVYNNLAVNEIEFFVTTNDQLDIDRVLNYPNPFVDYTEFWFQHNRPNEPLQVQVQILTVTGKLVKTINQVITTDGFLSRDITWDGKDDFGDKIGKGVYIYKLKVKSTISGQQVEKIEKLVVL